MGLLSRSPKSETAKSDTPKPAAAPRTARPRIRLRPAELKESNRLTKNEKLVGYAFAALGVIAVTAVALRGGLVAEERWRYPLIVVGFALFGVCVRYTNRMGASFGAAGAFLLWVTGYPKEYLLVYPLMGFMLYLTFASSKSRQKIMAERAAAGDFVNGPVDRQRAKGKPQTAATDAAGRAFAAKSKRYTPPKKK
jgi:hypothetical protein